ncbi:hypothetical protein ABGB14_21560 [Nonomuraea sp. B10E15]|uniref:hypothetical protein n=1 Tax=unclassified Nonomuraea TaxID=2593643 RepID=UPI00325E1DBF
MIITNRRLATVFAATVLAGGGALMAAPAAGAATSSAAAAVICPYQVKTKTTPKWLSATTVYIKGWWNYQDIVSVYQGSGKFGRVKTTSGYWATATDLTSAGQCRS